ncbi:hypothetical protein LCGC14_2324710 [marine sediment metagenome]|uniref:Uncharacterized protein n=1 Tax=marine sediment metagenome TaxID=412755 RepID=A0A0F9D4C3_9ZZZZ
MNIEIKCWTDTSYCGGDSEGMKINGKHRLSVSGLSDCPEDAIVGRDLIDCRQVSRFMAEAHKAGAEGEKLSIKIMEVEIRDEVFE